MARWPTRRRPTTCRVLAIATLVGQLCGAEAGGCSDGDDGTCAAGLAEELPVFPDCRYSCNEEPFIGPDSGNTKKIWPLCPGGDGACQDCDDYSKDCPRFAKAYNGLGCEDNPAYMIDYCAKSCNTCHLRNFDVRCEPLINAPEAIGPGDLDVTFERLLNMSSLKAEVLSRDPWILKFPNFLSDEEIKFLLDTEQNGGKWKEASDQGGKDQYGRVKQIFSSSRSTDVAWCGRHCHGNPTAVKLRARISEMVRVHPHYFESFQFLRYKEGQYYKAHHDASSVRRGRHEVAKHRIYTFFLYLNDVPKGGATNFPDLGIKVQPERGSAILWPSVRSSDPWQIDHRTRHEAQVVEEGVKYSMNSWVHLGPYTQAQNLACSGSPIG